jgi:hypothetical protein
MLISIAVAIEHRIRHSRALPHICHRPYVTFRTYFNILPPPLSTPVSPHPLAMAAIIAWYSVYAHYHQWLGMYVCEPACMYAIRGFRILFSSFG